MLVNCLGVLDQCTGVSRTVCIGDVVMCLLLLLGNIM